MNYILKYYYNLDDIRVVKNREKLYIKTTNGKFFLQEFNNIEKVNNIISLINEMNISSNFDQIIKTNFNKTYFEKNYKKYVLIKKRKNKRQVLIPIPDKIIINKYENIKRNNWYMLWLLKNKKIKETFVTRHNDNIINEMFDFFLGLADNAILYFKNVSSNKKSTQLFVSHDRVNDDIMNSPLNLVIDRRERDIAEMIKYLYFNLNNYDIEINKLIEQSLLENLSLEIVFSRVLYPTYYFDCIDEIDDINKYSAKKMINYELFLKKVYKIICDKKRIKKIDWL